MAHPDYEEEVVDGWSGMIAHFNTTVWPDFQRAGMDDKIKAFEIFVHNRTGNLLYDQLDEIRKLLKKLNGEWDIK